MSGGYFEGSYQIFDIAEKIGSLIYGNDNNYQCSYSDDTIEKFKYAAKILKECAVYVNRIDYLVSDDDGEETFHKRLSEDLKGLT